MDIENQNVDSLEKRFKKGDETAFKSIFEMYFLKLCTYINNYTNNSYDSQDIAQEAFIKLWDSRHKLSEEKSLGGYLFRIAHNIFIDKYRKNKKESKMIDALTYKKMLGLIEEDVDSKEAKISLMKDAIKQLPPRCKEIFEMSKIQGLKYHEIADLLAISVKTVEAQMGKAFKTIRNKVKGIDSLMLFITHSFQKT